MENYFLFFPQRLKYERTSLNIKVGKRATGGYEGKLDIVAFHPVSRKIVHIETSMGAESWGKTAIYFSEEV